MPDEQTAWEARIEGLIWQDKHVEAAAMIARARAVRDLKVAAAALILANKVYVCRCQEKGCWREFTSRFAVASYCPDCTALTRLDEPLPPLRDRIAPYPSQEWFDYAFGYGHTSGRSEIPERVLRAIPTSYDLTPSSEWEEIRLPDPVGYFNVYKRGRSSNAKGGRTP